MSDNHLEFNLLTNTQGMFYCLYEKLILHACDYIEIAKEIDVKEIHRFQPDYPLLIIKKSS